MALKRVPALDGSDLIPEVFIPTTIARTATTVATTDKGAANGVAPLNSSGLLDLTYAPAGFVVNLHFNGTAWPASRPTARTDITIWLDAPSGTAKPTWLLANDHFEVF